MSEIILDDVTFDGGGEIDAAFQSWRRAIERANRWSVAGTGTLDAGPSGFMLHIPSGRSGIRYATVATEIGASTGVDHLGSGTATLRIRAAGTGDLSDDDADPVEVYSEFPFAIPAGTRIKIVPEGDAWALVTARYCPPPLEAPIMLTWPGCCCDEDEPLCGPLCLTITQPGGSAVSGALVSGGSLGNCTTDSAGRCCLGVASPGTYEISISKSGYVSETFEVEVTADDCNDGQDVERPVSLDPTTLPAGCYDMLLWVCNCPRVGVAVVASWTVGGQVVTTPYTSRTNGRIRVCPPSGSTDHSLFIPGDGGAIPDRTQMGFFTGTINQSGNVGYWCYSDPDNPCMEDIPANLTATFSANFPNPDLAGASKSLNQTSLGADWATPTRWGSGSGWFALFVTAESVANPCGAIGGATCNLLVYSSQGAATPTANVSYNRDVSYGSTNCPVNIKFNNPSDPSRYIIVSE